MKHSRISLFFICLALVLAVATACGKKSPTAPVYTLSGVINYTGPAASSTSPLWVGVYSTSNFNLANGPVTYAQVPYNGSGSSTPVSYTMPINPGTYYLAAAYEPNGWAPDPAADGVIYQFYGGGSCGATPTSTISVGGDQNAPSFAFNANTGACTFSASVSYSISGTVAYSNNNAGETVSSNNPLFVFAYNRPNLTQQGANAYVAAATITSTAGSGPQAGAYTLSVPVTGLYYLFTTYQEQYTAPGSYQPFAAGNPYYLYDSPTSCATTATGGVSINASSVTTSAPQLNLTDLCTLPTNTIYGSIEWDSTPVSVSGQPVSLWVGVYDVADFTQAAGPIASDTVGPVTEALENFAYSASVTVPGPYYLVYEYQASGNSSPTAPGNYYWVYNNQAASTFTSGSSYVINGGTSGPDNGGTNTSSTVNLSTTNSAVFQ